MNTIFYMVSSGCNSRHLFDAKPFDLKRDAIDYANNLVNSIAYKLTRHEESNGFTVEITTIKERIL
jgi:hypothetical protein